MLYGMRRYLLKVFDSNVYLDTVYACQDIKDDVKMGVRSTAILFGIWIRPLLVGCGLTFAGMLALAGYLNRQGPAYFIVSVGGTSLHLVWQYFTVNLDVPKSCWRECVVDCGPKTKLNILQKILIATANSVGLCGVA